MWSALPHLAVTLSQRVPASVSSSPDGGGRDARVQDLLAFTGDPDEPRWGSPGTKSRTGPDQTWRPRRCPQRCGDRSLGRGEEGTESERGEGKEKARESQE